ncbi:hypothetical protein SAMN04488168_10472 [Bacillus sp. 491mf]|nr:MULTISPECIES: hypothetical protein [unclassified Bacillus (in: firmicutes)]SFC37615.1 hypothetical protein SAMN04488168_10472 [Bacillus sp. 491mf]
MNLSIQSELQLFAEELYGVAPSKFSLKKVEFPSAKDSTFLD